MIVKNGIYVRNYKNTGSWTSRESGVVEGTVRVIDNRLFFAFSVFKLPFLKAWVRWLPYIGGEVKHFV